MLGVLFSLIPGSNEDHNIRGTAKKVRLDEAEDRLGHSSDHAMLVMFLVKIDLIYFGSPSSLKLLVLVRTVR